MNKFFIITVDTEGDNLWNWHPGKNISTQNGTFIDQFQILCEKFAFKPVYLVNYEMARDTVFMNKLVEWEKRNNCEIGIHLHAWNNPPIRPLASDYQGQDYLIEYSEDVMREKFKVLYDQLTKVTGHVPFSHRAGRWAMDDRYFKILSDFGVKVDCSFTPGINWEKSIGVKSGGTNYTMTNPESHFIGDILEVPLTVKRGRAWGKGSLKHCVKSSIILHPIMLRPSGHSQRELDVVLNKVFNNPNSDYAEFMIHSSELMPGGSPYFPDSKSIEKLYSVMEYVFNRFKSMGYKGITLQEYYTYKKGELK